MAAPKTRLVGKKNGNWKGGRYSDPKNYHKVYIRKWLDEHPNYAMKSILRRQEVLAGRKYPDRCDVCCIKTKNLKKKLCFDHDHKTGAFRGWLCHRCNAALGMVDDSTKILEALTKYLKKSKVATPTNA